MIPLIFQIYIWSHTFSLAPDITQQPGEEQTRVSCCRKPIEFHFATGCSHGRNNEGWMEEKMNYWSLLWRLSLHVWHQKMEQRVRRSTLSQSHDLPRWWINQMKESIIFTLSYKKHKINNILWGGENKVLSQISRGCCLQWDATCLLSIISREFSRYTFNFHEFM